MHQYIQRYIYKEFIYNELYTNEYLHNSNNNIQCDHICSHRKKTYPEMYNIMISFQNYKESVKYVIDD